MRVARLAPGKPEGLSPGLSIHGRHYADGPTWGGAADSRNLSGVHNYDAAPMSASDDLAKAQAHVAAGHLRRALRASWRAADAALLTGDGDTLRRLAELAARIEAAASGGVARDAARLESYCHNSLDASGHAVESHAIAARLSRIRKTTRACPDCTAQIPEDARACRHCGYRDEPA